MKVKELIEILKQQNQEAEIRITSGYFEDSTRNIQLANINGDICIYGKRK